MTTIKAMRLASLVTAINVLVASGFSIAAIIRPQFIWHDSQKPKRIHRESNATRKLTRSR
jgi:hypothetical protein